MKQHRYPMLLHLLNNAGWQINNLDNAEITAYL